LAFERYDAVNRYMKYVAKWQPRRLICPDPSQPASISGKIRTRVGSVRAQKPTRNQDSVSGVELSVVAGISAFA
jgi:hypothetical protein